MSASHVEDPGSIPGSSTNLMEQIENTSEETLVAEGLVIMKDEDGKMSEVTLFDFRKDCDHEQDPNCWSGIKCRKCGGWFCY